MKERDPGNFDLEGHMEICSIVSTQSRQRGQGMTEYIIIVALIAIAAIGVYSFFGQTVRQPPATTAQEQSGKVANKDNSGVQPGKATGDNKSTAVNK